MPEHQGKKMAIEKRRQQVAEFYLHGWTQQRIAAELNTSQGTVCSDLKKLQKQWRESSIRDFDLARAEELQKLAQIEREAYEAWEQSKKPAQSAVVSGENGTAQARKTIKNRHGDPRLLEIVLKCIAARRMILGLD